ncbi:unnamed protein product, partial [Lampetra planeri]
AVASPPPPPPPPSPPPSPPPPCSELEVRRSEFRAPDIASGTVRTDASRAWFLLAPGGVAVGCEWGAPGGGVGCVWGGHLEEG